MKYLLLLITALLLVVSCGSNRQDTDTRIETIVRDTIILRDTSVIHDTILWNVNTLNAENVILTDMMSVYNMVKDKGTVFIKYKKPINGYNVDAIWQPVGIAGMLTDDFVGPALLRFNNGKEEFILLHESFFPAKSFTSKLRDGTLSTYESFFLIDYENGDHFNYDSPPFFFADVNFDGKKDLILTLRNSGPKWINLYRVYLFDTKPSYHTYDVDVLYRKTERSPFIDFDDHTQFDYKKKEIIISTYDGAIFCKEEYYRLNNEHDFELYKIIEYEPNTTSEYEIFKRKVSETKTEE